MIDLDQALFCAFVHRLMNCTDDRLVLDGSRHDCVASLLAHRSPGAKDREVVRLGSTRCEAELVTSRAEAAGSTLTRFVERSARFASPTVRARRVSEARAEERSHRFEDLVSHRSGRCVVEVNRILNCHSVQAKGREWNSKERGLRCRV